MILGALPSWLPKKKKPLSPGSHRNKTNKPFSREVWWRAGAPGRGSAASLPPTRRLCALITSPTVGHYLVMWHLTALWDVSRATKRVGQNTFSATTCVRPHVLIHSRFQTLSLCVCQAFEFDSPLMAHHGEDALQQHETLRNASFLRGIKWHSCGRLKEPFTRGRFCCCSSLSLFWKTVKLHHYTTWSFKIPLNSDGRQLNYTLLWSQLL